MLALSRFCPLFEMSGELGHGLIAMLDVPGVPEPFDYAELEEDVANEARAAEDIIRANIKSAMDSGIEIGRTLRRMKPVLGHGSFSPWVTVQLGMSMRTAQKLMSVAAMADKSADSAHLATLPMQLLEAMAAPSFPEPERVALLSDLASNAPPDKAAVRERIEKAKTSRAKPKASTNPAPFAAPDPVAPEAAVEALQKPTSVEPASSPVIEATSEPRPPEATAEAVEEPAAGPVQIEPRQTVQIQCEDIGPAVFKLAEDMRDSEWAARILTLAAQIGDDVLGRGLCRALRGEPVDDINRVEAGETTRPF
jgi:hypothetical protein